SGNGLLVHVGHHANLAREPVLHDRGEEALFIESKRVHVAGYLSFRASSYRLRGRSPPRSRPSWGHAAPRRSRDVRETHCLSVGYELGPIGAPGFVLAIGAPEEEPYETPKSNALPRRPWWSGALVHGGRLWNQGSDRPRAGRPGVRQAHAHHGVGQRGHHQ